MTKSYKWWTISWGRYIPHQHLMGWWVKLGPFSACGYRIFPNKRRVEIRFDAIREIDPYSEDRRLILE